MMFYSTSPRSKLRLTATIGPSFQKKCQSWARHLAQTGVIIPLPNRSSFLLLARTVLPSCHPLAVGKRRFVNAGSEVLVCDRRRFRDWPAKPVLHIYVYSVGRPRWFGAVGAPRLARLSTGPRSLRVEHVGLS